MTENQYKRKNTSVSLINYHFVFCPKRRKRVLVNEVSRRLEEIIYQKALIARMRYSSSGDNA
jgi:putative transposase